MSEPRPATCLAPARPRFTADDAERAYREWGANCGPGAVAAIFGLTLDEVRPHMGIFEQRAARYTNPALMREVLGRIAPLTGRRWEWKRIESKTAWPTYGLARVQWEGPWTKPGVPMRVRYRWTHWVGASRINGEIGVFDINAMGNGSGWSSLADWNRMIVPWILDNCVPRANGEWHLTHRVEVMGAE